MRRYARTRRRIIYCPCESHGAAAGFRDRTKHSPPCAWWFLARPAPLRLGLLIVLELLVRRIIELRLLPRMMMADGPWGPRRSHPDHASARQLMKTKSPYEMLYETVPSGGGGREGRGRGRGGRCGKLHRFLQFSSITAASFPHGRLL